MIPEIVKTIIAEAVIASGNDHYHFKGNRPVFIDCEYYRFSKALDVTIGQVVTRSPLPDMTEEQTSILIDELGLVGQHDYLLKHGGDHCYFSYWKYGTPNEFIDKLSNKYDIDSILSVVEYVGWEIIFEEVGMPVDEFSEDQILDFISYVSANTFHKDTELFQYIKDLTDMRSI